MPELTLVEAVRAALARADAVVVLDRAVSPGGAAPLHAEMAAALYGGDADLLSFVYGLGGRDLLPAHVREALAAGPGPLRYLGLRGEAIVV